MSHKPLGNQHTKHGAIGSWSMYGYLKDKTSVYLTSHELEEAIISAYILRILQYGQFSQVTKN